MSDNDVSNPMVAMLQKSDAFLRLVTVKDGNADYSVLSSGGRMPDSYDLIIVFEIGEKLIAELVEQNEVSPDSLIIVINDKKSHDGILEKIKGKQVLFGEFNGSCLKINGNIAEFIQVRRMFEISGIELEQERNNFEQILEMSKEMRKLSKQNIEKPTKSQKAEVINPQDTIFHLIIALDITGSMQSSINMMKESLITLIQTIKDSFPSVMVSVYGFMDHCDHPVYISKVFTNDFDSASQFIKTFVANGGGDTPEAHRTCLANVIKDIESLPTKNLTNVCLLISDAPPHRLVGNNAHGNPAAEKEYMTRNFPEILDWVHMTAKMSEMGIQVFSFEVAASVYDSLFAVYMTTITGGLSFHVSQQNTQELKDQLIMIVRALITQNGQIEARLKLLSLDDSMLNATSERDLFKNDGINIIQDGEAIDKAISESSKLMRLPPSARGAKRVIIDSSGLVKTGKDVVEALYSLKKIIEGHNEYYEFFENHGNLYKKIGEEIKAANPSKTWLSETQVQCMVSFENLAEKISSLEIPENPKLHDLLEILSEFVIGYPYLFYIVEGGKFNLQDAWPIHLLDVSTSYMLSAKSLFDLIDHSDSLTEIKSFKGLMHDANKSGLVSCVPKGDLLAHFICRIMDNSQWLGAIMSYSLHRHVEPLPSITNAVSSNFILSILKKSFTYKETNLSENNRIAIENVFGTIKSLIQISCKDMTIEFESSLKNYQIPYRSFVAQDPINCSAFAKILNVMIHHRQLIFSLPHDFAIQLFHAILSEDLTFKVRYLNDEKRKNYLLSAFGECNINTDIIDQEHFLERTEPSEPFSELVELLPPFVQQSCYMISQLWKFFRMDEYNEPGLSFLNAAYLQALFIYPRSVRFIETAEKIYEIDPQYIISDPILTLSRVRHLFYQGLYKSQISKLQLNRKEFQKKSKIDEFLSTISKSNLQISFNVLMEPHVFPFQTEGFSLQMQHSEEILNRIISLKTDHDISFLRPLLTILVLGEHEQYIWQPKRAFRDKEKVLVISDTLLKTESAAFMDLYYKKAARMRPNRHGHTFGLCSFREDYTRAYARDRLIALRELHSQKETPFVVPKKLAHTMSRKHHAPSFEEIYTYLNEVLNALNENPEINFEEL